MLKRSIHSAFSTNCIAAVLLSNCWISGSVTARPARAPTRASQRTALTWSSRPRASRRAPNAIGTQIERLNQCIFVLPLLLVEPHEIRHESENAQQHDQRVVIEIARLQLAHPLADAADELPRTVDDGAIEDRKSTRLNSSHLVISY